MGLVFIIDKRRHLRLNPTKCNIDYRKNESNFVKAYSQNDIK